MHRKLQEKVFGVNVPVRFRRYRITRLLERGSFRDLYLGVDSRLNTKVVIGFYVGIMSDEFSISDRLTDAILNLRHDNLARVIDADMVDGNVVVVMDYVEGESMVEYVRNGVKSGQCPDLARLSGVFVGLVDGLEALHEHGVIHRMLPGSVVVTESGRVVIIDLCWFFPVGGSGSFGASQHAAPEQRGGTPIGPAADMHALGQLLYKCLTGEWPPLEQDGHVYADRRVRGVPRKLRLVCKRLLDPNPDARPSYDEVRRGLELSRFQRNLQLWRDNSEPRKPELFVPESTWTKLLQVKEEPGTIVSAADLSIEDILEYIFALPAMATAEEVEAEAVLELLRAALAKCEGGDKFDTLFDGIDSTTKVQEIQGRCRQIDTAQLEERSPSARRQYRVWLVVAVATLVLVLLVTLLVKPW